MVGVQAVTSHWIIKEGILLWWERNHANSRFPQYTGVAQSPFNPCQANSS
jgi:hypothetical protein